VKYTNTKPCTIGWSDPEYNWQGSCCCNCKNQQPLSQHPSNRSVIGKGPSSALIGFICVAPELHPHTTFFDHTDTGEHHGMCECWEEQNCKVTDNGHTVPADEKQVPAEEE